MAEFFATYPYLIYFCFFLLPFAQEDVSILGAASVCASGIANPFFAFILVLLGLTTSAMGKYMIGSVGASQSWTKKFTEDPKVIKAGENVKTNLGKSLFMARFIPPVRIPFYVAAGLFKMNALKVLFFVVTSAILYLSVAFGAFHFFGEAIGSKLKVYLPVAAVVILVIYFIFIKIRGPKPLSE
ncbi:VTT domain-containing protein [Hellea sp.]|nr:VTT domain-containing protein [Hellea sp.]